MKNLYKTFFQKKLYVKIIGLFSVMTVLSVITLFYMLSAVMSESITRVELDNQEEAMELVDDVIRAKTEQAQSLMLSIYRNDPLYSDFSAFLTSSYEDYIQKRLNRAHQYPGFDFPNATRYFKDFIDDNRDVRHAIIYSGETQALYALGHSGNLKRVEVNASRSYIPEFMASDVPLVSVPNVWVRKAIGEFDPNLFAVSVPITQVRTFRPIGKLVLLYDTEAIRRAAGEKAEAKGSIGVVAADGKLLYRSPETPKDVTFALQPDADAEANYYITTLANPAGGYTVVSAVSKALIAEESQGVRVGLAIVGLACIGIAIAVSSWFIVRLSKRTNRIIGFMRRAETGDMAVRIPDEKDDELGQISRSFNQMLDELSKYIDRVYKAEIKQKNAEMAALQARVNPHFLYNTLEVIRMRAVSQGAKDVGEMIYSMSSLFRNFVKPKPRHTLRDELGNCRLYLELFRIRYKDKFRYEIDCEPELREMEMISTSLLPIVENYIVHGLRTEAADNVVSIQAVRDEDDIRFVCADNGAGIEPDRLERIRATLNDPDMEAESFGLRSVLERLILFYGNRARLEVDSAPGVGTTVTAWIPIQGEHDDHV
ncbi:sensor histidine kinase [Paenibacillus sp.]|uniref:sensor histidine kinase n=1 Tax=Paenibacillus sp. TaxID=58172 RepID=UPI0028111892|nr:sensor histidine kinase [Paenibacillus sp.]